MKYKSIIFDFDSTIVSIEGLEFLAEVSLANNPNKEIIFKKIKRITNLSMNGKIKFDKSLSERVNMLSPTRSQALQAGTQIAKLISKSFLKNKKFFSKYAENIYVISGGFEELIIPSTEKLGILKNKVFANQFIFNDHDKVIGLDSSRLTSKHLGKVKQLKALHLPIPAVIIGDGYTDYEVKERGVVQDFIVYTEHAKRDNVVQNADFRAKTFSDILKFIT